MKGIYRLFFPLCILCSFFSAYGQSVNITAEIRPRFEYRHGYKTLFPDQAEPAVFISQRTRLNADFAGKSFRAYVSTQNIRVWGDVSQLNKVDKYAMSVHEAWGEILFSESVSLKIGRQEIIYDDHRIFGNVGWTQQARSHDAAMLKLKPNENHHVDLVVAYNAGQESLYRETYTLTNYKTFQVMHYQGRIGKSSLNFLFLNNGLPYDADPDSSVYKEKVSYSRTVGGRYSMKREKFGLNMAAYYQGGKNKMHNNLSAYYLAGDLSLYLIGPFSFGAGFEVLSGTDTRSRGVSGATDHSFTPFYGTNHKFNGWMDYFYVGNHGGNVGLIDIYFPFKLTLEKIGIILVSHTLRPAATLATKTAVPGEWTEYHQALGTEFDLSVAWKMAKNVTVAGGYSRMFSSQAMQALKYPDIPDGEFNKNTNHWAWVMVTFKPTLFTRKSLK
ncbi:MAG: hypothetical protein J7K46_03305 [Bacteroidales bacterium]|nr:hypothetical protein [Bacteroidales bacterium]